MISTYLIFFVGISERKIFFDAYNDINKLRRRIQEVIGQITNDKLGRVIANFIKRCKLCIQQGGGKFEQLLKRTFFFAHNLTFINKNHNNKKY